MTRLLTIAGDETDLKAAIDGGADVVELRDVTTRLKTGLPEARIRSLAGAARGRVDLRAPCRPWPMRPDRTADAIAELDATGIDEIAVGPFRHDTIGDVAALGRPGGRARLIAVLDAEDGPARDAVAMVAAAGFAGVSIEIGDPAAGRLLDRMTPAALAAFVAGAHAEGLTVGLAGALEAPDVPRLVALGADALGFRTVLLDRATGRLDAAHVAAMAALIAGSARVGGGVAPARPPTDRIFVRDFVVDMDIGVYLSEHGRLQKVRFDVVVDVAPAAAKPRDMRDVFSYDLILDGIRAIAAQGHVDLVETVAEEVARIVLAHPAAETVQVRVEKLELGAGGVGVEIRRSRA